MQTFMFYVNYRDDPLRMKSFVAAIWALDTVHEALTIAGVYKFVVADLTNPSSMLKGIPELVLQFVFMALGAVTMQGFFVYRIYLFSGKNIIGPLLWVPMAIYQLVSTLLYVTKALYSADGVHVVEVFVLNEPFFMDMASSSLSVGAAVDVLIAVVFTLLLLRKGIATEFSSTAHILRRLILFVVNAGIWTATFALLCLIFLHLYRSASLYVVFGYPLCSVYCNTLLANLNARAYIRGETTTLNTDADLFTSSTQRVPDSNRDDKHCGGARMISFRTSANELKATEV
ncbi:hypothetical protein HD554DRAFT_2098636 [Boletus coccyginus]|nr:hypothetical protein HD554DRAFT_2098636 [Boletus coccyginus]